MSVQAQNSDQESSFKVLRAVNPAVLGATQRLQVAKEVQFPNAKGKLRLVAAESEVRALAHSNAQNLLAALAHA